MADLIPTVCPESISRRKFAATLGTLGAIAAVGTLSACSSSNNDALRDKNLATVKEFLAETTTEGKAKFYLEDSAFMIPFYFGGKPHELNGLEAINKQWDLNLEHYSDMDFQVKEVIAGDDPNQFWIRIHFVGKLIAGGMDTEIVIDPMVLFFQMKDGKILRWEEYFNPLVIYTSAGIELPEIY
ncbi:MAG: nuclear transport factor 2 family protein [Coriobacteriia bacterium]